MREHLDRVRADLEKERKDGIIKCVQKGNPWHNGNSEPAFRQCTHTCEAYVEVPVYILEVKSLTGKNPRCPRCGSRRLKAKGWTKV